MRSNDWDWIRLRDRGTLEIRLKKLRRLVFKLIKGAIIMIRVLLLYSGGLVILKDRPLIKVMLLITKLIRIWDAQLLLSWGTQAIRAALLLYLSASRIFVYLLLICIVKYFTLFPINIWFVILININGGNVLKNRGCCFTIDPFTPDLMLILNFHYSFNCLNLRERNKSEAPRLEVCFVKYDDTVLNLAKLRKISLKLIFLNILRKTSNEYFSHIRNGRIRWWMRVGGWRA